ncbi:ABC transporter ATP-binding protein [Methanolobus sp. ZRKC2]|uniref:ABC transporter ATP-binding protein n=1 Tax=Methanolobus sp. ZRKC2 TaxID=3125783 RepID=UPI003245B528
MELLLEIVKKKKLEFLLSVTLAALGSVLYIVPYVIIFYIIRYYLESGINAPAEPVIQMLVYGLVAIVLRYILVTSSFVFSHIAAFDLLYIIRKCLTEHIGTLPMGFWTSNNTGRIRKVIQEDVETIENFVAHHIPDMVSGLVLPIVTLILLFTVDWRLALAAALPLPIGLVLVKMMWSGAGSGQKRREAFKEYHDSLEKMNSTSVEYVQGMPAVKVFNQTLDSFKRLKKSVIDYRKFVLRISKTSSPYWAGFSAIVIGGGIFVIPAGIYLLQTGQIDVATMILFLLLGLGCFCEFVPFITIVSHSEYIFEGTKRIESILAEESLPEPDLPLLPTTHDIRLDNVSFQYHETDVLSNINASIPEGSFTAIVGPSGAGKTTLVNLMARMWDVSCGEIRIGGVGLQEMGTYGVNKTVGTVFQEVQMLTDTVRENIRMGKDGVSQESIEKAAMAAACHDFILSLPKGYDTVIGEGGEVHLSGGEKQRIALARVILKDPPIILLDEASSYADAENETRMQEAFSRLMTGKTVVVIAHRLSTIVNADSILVVNKGKIVEQGTHEQLLEKHKLYYSMWKAHTKARHWKLSEEVVLSEAR